MTQSCADILRQLHENEIIDLAKKREGQEADGRVGAPALRAAHRMGSIEGARRERDSFIQMLQTAALELLETDAAPAVPPLLHMMRKLKARNGSA